MKISEQTYQQLNELLRKSFDCNARADNLAYNLDYAVYPNIQEVYHHKFAHKFPELADVISELMIKLNARPIRKQIGGYAEVFETPLKVFEENDKMAEEYRREIYKTIDIADLNEDYEVRIAIEDFLLKFLPYVKQSDIWLNKAKQYKNEPWQFDIHFKELTTLI